MGGGGGGWQRQSEERRQGNDDRFATGTGTVVSVWWKDSLRPGTSNKGKQNTAPGTLCSRLSKSHRQPTWGCALALDVGEKEVGTLTVSETVTASSRQP